MELSFKELRGLLVDKWPDLRDIWLLDTKYVLPSDDDVKRFLENDTTNLLKQIPGVFECNAFATQLLAASQRYVLEIGSRTPWSLGLYVAVVDTVFGDNVHSGNICVMDDKRIMMIEPKNDRLYEPTDEQVFFVFM